MATMNLKQRLKDLNAQIAKEQARFKAAVAEAIDEVLADYELSLADLPTKATKGTRKRKPPFKGTQPAKYQDPATGATWSGFGRPPAWINGKKRDRFLIAH